MENGATFRDASGNEYNDITSNDTRSQAGNTGTGEGTQTNGHFGTGRSADNGTSEPARREIGTPSRPTGGTTAKRRRRRTRAEIENTVSRTNPETGETEDVVLTPDDAEYIPIDAKQTRTRRTAASKLASTDVAQLVAILFLLWSMTKSPVLRTCWEYDVEECENVAVPLAKILNRMPSQVISTVQNLTDPITLFVALIAMIRNSQEREQKIVKAIREKQARDSETDSNSSPIGATRHFGDNGTGRTVEDVTARRFDIPVQNT
jgi:hypothetical protein